jgi:transposase
MDSHTNSAQVQRFEVVDTGRRRRWSEHEKLRIVMESLQDPRQASATARRHAISPSLLFTWRRAFGVCRSAASHPSPGFVPAVDLLQIEQALQNVASRWTRKPNVKKR